MKLSLDPLPALREQAERAINDHFNRLTYEAGQRDAEHAAKREAARNVTSRSLLQQHLQEVNFETFTPAWFVEAAAIEGVTPDAFAAAILSKPDEAAVRGNARRAAIVKVRAAISAAAVESVLADLGL